jgi:monoterpene epsilon-lactone hydrolase
VIVVAQRVDVGHAATGRASWPARDRAVAGQLRFIVVPDLRLPPAVVRPVMGLVARRIFSPSVDWPTARERWDGNGSFPPPPATVAISETIVGGVPAHEHRPCDADETRVLLYLHGGGYAAGSPTAYKTAIATVAAATNWRTIAPDYRLGPEHRFPAAVEDVVAVWQALVADGTDPASIVVAGDSAGGGLTLALALSLKSAGAPLPGALGLLCPWVDLRPETNAGRPVAHKEPTLSRQLIGRMAEAYLGKGCPDAENPLASPILGDLDGLPPTVVHACDLDYLAVDGRNIAMALREAGVPLLFAEHPDLWHDAPLQAALMRGSAGRSLTDFAVDLVAALALG